MLDLFLELFLPEEKLILIYQRRLKRVLKSTRRKLVNQNRITEKTLYRVNIKQKRYDKAIQIYRMRKTKW